MIRNKKLILFFYFFVLSNAVYAQVEIGNLHFKHYSVATYGAFLNIAAPISKTNGIIIGQDLLMSTPTDSAGLANDNLFLLRIWGGYLHILNNSGHGLYVEPTLGGSFALSSIKKTDVNGIPIVDVHGKYETQNATGPMTGLEVGYISPAYKCIRYQVGLKFDHVYVIGGPAENIAMFTFGETIWGKKKHYQYFNHL